MADDPTLPQSAFPYPAGAATPGTPTGSEALLSVSGPVPSKQGQYFIQSSPAANLTLALHAPIAGSPANGGDDGNEIEFVNLDGRTGHQIKVGTNLVNGAYANVTLHDSSSPPNALRSMKMIAYGGVWYCNTSGVTLS
jgi:hypothetical protein